MLVVLLFHCRGLLGRSIITAQSASPTFTHVYAALVAIVNTKFPQVGELIIKRVIVNFKKGFRRNDKVSTIWNYYIIFPICHRNHHPDHVYGFSQLLGLSVQSASGKCAILSALTFTDFFLHCSTVFSISQFVCKLMSTTTT